MNNRISDVNTMAGPCSFRSILPTDGEQRVILHRCHKQTTDCRHQAIHRQDRRQLHEREIHHSHTAEQGMSDKVCVPVLMIHKEPDARGSSDGTVGPIRLARHEGMRQGLAAGVAAESAPFEGLKVHWA